MDLVFLAAWEDDKAPKTCAAIRKLLPLMDKLVQARWSGEAAWISIDHLDLDRIDFENHNVAASRLPMVSSASKEILMVLWPYRIRQQNGSRYPAITSATIMSGLEQLVTVLGTEGRALDAGAQDVELTEALLLAAHDFRQA